MATIYMDNLVIADTLTVVGQTSTSETIGTLTVTTSMVSAAGKIGLGASPGTTGAINVDGASYIVSGQGVAFSAVHGTAAIRINVANNTSAGVISAGVGSLLLGANNQSKWGIDADGSGTSTLTSSSAIAKFVGGATSTTFYQSNGSTIAMQYLSTANIGLGIAANADAGVVLGAGGSTYLIRHGTAATFNVTNAGNMTLAGSAVVGAAVYLGWTGRSLTASPADGQANLSNQAVSAGVGLDFATDAILKIRTRAQTGDAALTCSAITAGASVAITAGGSLLGLMVSSTASFGFFVGSGAPTIAAAKGSYYARSDGSSTSTRGYIATDSVGGWTNVVTAA